MSQVYASVYALMLLDTHFSAEVSVLPFSIGLVTFPAELIVVYYGHDKSPVALSNASLLVLDIDSGPLS